MDSNTREMSKTATVPTRLLILADTHGRKDIGIKPDPTYDLAIHCGDLTQESKISEFRSTLELLRNIPAPVKVVIAGNHEITLEEEMYRKHLLAAGVEPTDPDATREYGEIGEARRMLLAAAKEDGIVFLEEGTHTLRLPNGASPTVYVNPWTPRRKKEGSLGSSEAGWAYQYDASDSHTRFRSPQAADIYITHGPPEGLLDYVDRGRAGCPALFKSVCQVRPQLHCFGHIHPGWGAKLVTWRGAQPKSTTPSHMTEIGNEESAVLEKLSLLKPARTDDGETKLRKKDRLHKLLAQGYCKLDDMPIQRGKQTMFVNAAVEGDTELPIRPPIAVLVNLPGRSVVPRDSFKE